jgi:hypothetical protein
MGDVTPPRRPALEEVVGGAAAARVDEELGAKADEAARGQAKLHAHATSAVIDHLHHGAAASSDLLRDHTDPLSSAANEGNSRGLA